MTAVEILNALIAVSDSRIWATELAFNAGMRRIDFYTLEPTLSQSFRTSAYEIKVSRADYLRDSADKQDAALKWSDRFWYVTPAGLLELGELPDWAGLQEWDGTAFSIRRKAPMRRKADPDWQFVVSLLRNSGDCRRDVQLMKVQISFLQQRLDAWTRQRKLSDQIKFERWKARTAKAVQA